MHQSSYEKMHDFRVRYLAGRASEPLAILDVGAMDLNGSYRPIFDEPAWHYRGADLEPGRNVDLVLAEPYHFKAVESNSLDVVVSGQALEHMSRFWLFFLEVFRCLKPGGLCCVIAPSGGYEHRYPVDCWRFYPDGMRAAAEYARLEVLEARTDWKPATHYIDDSAVWQDSVLVARKPQVSVWRGFKLNLRSSLLRALR
ncbi:MAG: class I SAM-dependent methyltransferase [Chromatiaceae bacterium]|nr:class I SAM-dependent methyltransferase [Chromatiaceae bacterium]